MQYTRQQLLSSIALGFLGILSVPQCNAAGPYSFLKEISVAGDGGGDYLTTDAAARRVYVTHSSKIVVIDLEKNDVVGEITDTLGVHGFAIAPELRRGFSSNGKENKVSIVDLKTLQTLFKVETGANPDGILYEPEHQEVYAFNGRGNSATVFAAKTGKVVATIPLPGKPEFAVVDAKVGRIYNNIEDKNEVVVIDTKSHEVVARWPIAPGEAASGMALDQEHHRLFLGCDNEMMVMMDSTNGKVISNVPIGAGVDANRFDPETQFAFASCGDAGTVTIAREAAPDKLILVQTLTTAPGAKTMTLDPKTHRIYLACAKTEEASAADSGAGKKKGKAKIIPGSFRVLVYEMRR